ncbi:MAG: hypothetical protein ACXAEF_02080 [Candidatus Thorarchaeota archaeon]|jgi:hypothetical protein
MDFITLGALLVLSIIACAIGGEIVKRKEIQINRWILLVFHLLYGVGLIAAMLTY